VTYSRPAFQNLAKTGETSEIQNVEKISDEECESALATALTIQRTHPRIETAFPRGSRRETIRLRTTPANASLSRDESGST
jgi:hypothetical protein